MVHSEKAQTIDLGCEQSLNHRENIPPRLLTFHNSPSSGLRPRKNGCILPSKMKTKLSINDRIITPDGLHGIIVEVEPIGEFKIILDSGETAYWFPEDLRKEASK